MALPTVARQIMQVCWVVDDLDAAMAHWTSIMGIGPFYIFRDLHLDKMEHRGQPTTVHCSIASAQSGSVQIELVQQHCDNPSAYRELVSAGHNGMHHVAVYVADYDAAFEHYTQQGLQPSVTGLFGDMRYAYFDASAELACMVELIEHDSFQDKIFKRIREGALAWDGVTDPVRSGWPEEE